MFCEKCGKELQEGIKFCTNCGAKVEIPGEQQPGGVTPQMPDPMQQRAPALMPGAAPVQPGADQMPNRPPLPPYMAGSPNTGPMQPAKKSKLPIVIIAVAAVLVIAGVAVGGVFAFKKIRAKKETEVTPGDIEGFSDEDDRIVGDEDITLEDPPVMPDTEDIKEEPVKEEPVKEEDQDGGVKEEPFKEEIKEEPSKEEKGDWFEAHNLKLTPQGDFSFHTMLYEKDKGDLGEMWLPGTVKITENTNDVPAGYKNVVAYFELSVAHMDNMENRAPNHWITAFDKKTGICFETDDENPAKDENGFVTIDGADGSFKEKVKFEYGWKDNGTIRQARATVTVPSDYEDTVFQIGYGSTELAEESDRTIDLKSRLYRIDELLFFDTNGHEYLYFAADKNSSSGKENTGNNTGENDTKTNLSDEEILSLAKKKSGAPNAVIEGTDPDGTLNIRLYGKDTADTWDWYYIDPGTLEGTNILGEKISLK